MKPLTAQKQASFMLSPRALSGSQNTLLKGATPYREGASVAPVAVDKSSLGVRPIGDTEIQPDMSKIHSKDLKKLFSYEIRHAAPG
jgi:hypothetical protein